MTRARLGTGPTTAGGPSPGGVVGRPLPPSVGPDGRRHGPSAPASRLSLAPYEHRVLPEDTLEPERLALLADALKDAGCMDPELLGHFRGPGPHVRGCWCVDLLLGRS